VCWRVTPAEAETKTKRKRDAGRATSSSAPGEGVSVLGMGIQGGTALSCRVVEAAATSRMPPPPRHAVALVLLPPILFSQSEDAADGVTSADEAVLRAEREAAAAAVSLGWDDAPSGGRLVLVVAAADAVADAVGGRPALAERLCASVSQNADGDRVRVLLLDEEEVVEAMGMSALALALPSSDLPHGHVTLDGISAAASVGFIQLCRMWGAGAACLSASRPRAAVSDEARGRARLLDGLESSLAWASARASMTPVVSELTGAHLLRQAWSRSLRAMPDAAGVESESLLRTGLEVFAQCVDQVASLARHCSAALDAVPSLHGQARRCGEAVEVLPSVARPLLQRLESLPESALDNPDDARALMTGAARVCSSLIDASCSHPVAAAARASHSDNSARAEAAKANVMALSCRALPGEGEAPSCAVQLGVRHRTDALVESRRRSLSMLQEVIALRIEQVERAGLLVPTLDAGLVEWGLRSEAAAASREWRMDGLALAAGRDRSPSPRDAQHSVPGEGSECSSAQASPRGPRLTLDFSDEGGAAWRQAAAACQDGGALDCDASGEEDEFLGPGLAERLRALEQLTGAVKAQGRVARSSPAAAGSSHVRELSSGKRRFAAVLDADAPEPADVAAGSGAPPAATLSQRPVRRGLVVDVAGPSSASRLSRRPASAAPVSDRLASECEASLQGLLDFDSGQGHGQQLMREYGFLPRVTATYRDFLGNIGLGWIAKGRST